MNSFVFDFYAKNEIEGIEDPFFKTIILEDDKLSYEEIKKKSPTFPKSYFDLLKLNKEDRIDFVLDFWLKNLILTYDQHSEILSFFSKIDTICIVLVKEFPNQPYVPEIVYAMEDQKMLFRGKLGKTLVLTEDINLPVDYLSFFKIHSGFRKLNDPGLISAENFMAAKNSFQREYLHSESELLKEKKGLDPARFVPFYKDAKGGYMCFFTESDLYSSFGNLCYVSNDFTITNNQLGEKRFFTFLDWFCHYLKDEM